MMSSCEGLVFILSSMMLLSLVMNMFHILWWTPMRIQSLMASQGIKGPSYRCIHGNAKEISNMRKEAMSRPINLSHDILSAVQPHFHSWSKIYGTVFLQRHGP
ncbi:hypothetical protein ABKV19_008344 [Rosa sericea]